MFNMSPLLKSMLVAYTSLFFLIMKYLRKRGKGRFTESLKGFRLTFAQICLDSVTSKDHHSLLERLIDLQKQINDFVPGENFDEVNDLTEIKLNFLAVVTAMKTVIQDNARLDNTDISDLYGGKKTKRRRRTGKRIRKTHKRRRQKRTHRRRKN